LICDKLIKLFKQNNYYTNILIENYKIINQLIETIIILTNFLNKIYEYFKVYNSINIRLIYKLIYNSLIDIDTFTVLLNQNSYVYKT
jgi:hypothetical protein